MIFPTHVGVLLLSLTSLTLARPIPRPSIITQSQPPPQQPISEAYPIPGSTTLTLHRAFVPSASPSPSSISFEEVSKLLASATEEAETKNGPAGTEWTWPATNENNQVRIHIESEAPRFLWRDVKDILRGVESVQKSILKDGKGGSEGDLDFEIQQDKGEERAVVLAKGWVARR
ncbi:uncharacterized protein KY384_005170 [Bacidia gigantensis]|uniref:uncharacterized protein n=1 Tax=Bacidia gigantensis TaxID=2732470 RepID=UPI001D04DB87|nr:uncharacterized protein KY384_005170 [Bacidia gigantensis]KAG8529689.1 hypothetical protein KY384_005170 [Bacidia gigantensis]